MHGVCNGYAKVWPINVHPACLFMMRVASVTGYRGSILQLLFTVGMTWRTERCSATQRSTGPVTSATGRHAPTALLMPLKWHVVGFVFAVLQLCQCATDSRCDWLKLMEGGGVIIDCTHTQKVDQTVPLLYGFNE